jgi:hypothetical protein
MLATAQPRCRRCVVGVWVVFCWGQGIGIVGWVLGVASRGWACARRDRSGGDGFRADARWGLGCCDPMLATAQPRCRRCVVGVWVFFFVGDRGLGLLGGFLGWLRGVGPALAGIVREVMAFALTRDGGWVAAILCSLRPNPAAAGVWSGYGWVFIGDRLMVNGDLGSGAVVGELQDRVRAALTRVGGLRSFCGHVRVA